MNPHPAASVERHDLALTGYLQTRTGCSMYYPGVQWLRRAWQYAPVTNPLRCWVHPARFSLNVGPTDSRSKAQHQGKRIRGPGRAQATTLRHADRSTRKQDGPTPKKNARSPVSRPNSCRLCKPCPFPFAARFSHNLDAIMGRSACPVNGWPAPFAAPPGGRLAAPVWPFPFGDRALHSARPFDARVMRNRDAKERNRQCRIQNGRIFTPASPGRS